MELSKNIINKSHELGFIDVGVSNQTVENKNLVRLEENFRNNYNGTMRWLERSPEIRIDASNLLEDAKSVICFAYLVPIGKIKHSKHARFAQGEDYHKVLKSKLNELVEILKDEFLNIKTKICVDTSPVFEKAFAANAGLGFIGKNTLLIHPEFGSNIVLGEIITNIGLATSNKQQATNKCGNCTKCMDACPTKAIVKPYVLDARKCISYLSIEHKGEIPKEFQKYVSENTYGCDVCANACPYNG